jgi:hypothetical protein
LAARRRVGIPATPVAVVAVIVGVVLQFLAMLGTLLNGFVQVEKRLVAIESKLDVFKDDAQETRDDVKALEFRVSALELERASSRIIQKP